MHQIHAIDMLVNALFHSMVAYTLSFYRASRAPFQFGQKFVRDFEIILWGSVANGYMCSCVVCVA